MSFRALCRRSEEMLLATYLVEEPAYVDDEVEYEDDMEYFIEEEEDIKKEVLEEEWQSWPKPEPPEEPQPVVVFYEEVAKNSSFKLEDVPEDDYEQVEILEEITFVPNYHQSLSQPEPEAVIKKPRVSRKPAGQRIERTKINDVIRLCNQPLEGPYHCVPCDRVYTKKASFFSHYRDTHDPSPRRFTCDLCGITYKRRVTLNDHLNVHRNVKPFGCDVCGSFFARKYALRKHMECHAKDKKFKCKYCGRGFSFYIDERRHETVHTGRYIVSSSLLALRKISDLFV